MKRANWTYLAASAIVLIAGVSGATAGSKFHTHATGVAHGDYSSPRGHDAPSHHRHGRSSTTTTRETTTTAGSAAVSTTSPPAQTITQPPSTPQPTVSTTSPPTTLGTPRAPGCSGVAMTSGQSDIDSHAAGTTFCLSGTHNWTLTPKSGDELIGPATLDGGNSTAHAIVATAPNVVLTSLTIQHYNNGNGSQDGAIHIADDDGVKATASGWRLNALDVGFNSAAGSGTGNGWVFTGGRFHDNHQEGIGGAMGTGVTINNVEVDHNDFTDTSYTRRNWSCGDEAGGVKWVTNNMTVENSSIHDNACKGLWADLNGDNAVITNNHVYNNWDEGIFIEISSGATVTNNVVTNNGNHNYNGSGSGCPWLFGGGITLAASDHANVAGNTLSGNCNGITLVQQDRPDGHPGLLENDNIHNNTIQGPKGVTGAAEDNGANLGARNIVFSANTISNGMSFCSLSC
jgi:parallel beta-helix repeat protein